MKCNCKGCTDRTLGYIVLIQENKRVDKKGVNDLPSSCFSTKPVRDLRNNKLYETVNKTAKELNTYPSLITTQCKKKNSYLMYESEFQKLSLIEQNNLLSEFHKEAI